MKLDQRLVASFIVVAQTICIAQAAHADSEAALQGGSESTTQNASGAAQSSTSQSTVQAGRPRNQNTTNSINAQNNAAAGRNQVAGQNSNSSAGPAGGTKKWGTR